MKNSEPTTLTPKQQLCKMIWEEKIDSKESLKALLQIANQISNLNYLDEFGKSPLYLAVEKSSLKAIVALTKLGASATFKNYNSDETPIKLATRNSMDVDLFNTDSVYYTKAEMSDIDDVTTQQITEIGGKAVGQFTLDFYKILGIDKNTPLTVEMLGGVTLHVNCSEQE